MVFNTSFPQTSECGTTPSSVQELRLDERTLSGWRYDSMETIFPGVEKATLYIYKQLRVDDLDALRLPALRELCLKRDPYFECKFTEWPSLCKRLCSSFSRLQKVAFINLPIGGDNARMILSSLRQHPMLAEIR